ncbi:cysteine hydrolase family protein [Acidihalobacter ferrooxydans]|uniref:Amidase n=1 Tax=Acidihalobacter ferrooxydans TaxID=1765967 RepID=A0A1P8UI80_9GAMM|nr:cysteine hydrolase family protein [Acidihalobacter ferrooxydans]APZ43536.1 amidase [Acidihalobacter ferrooxydans]
MDWKNAYRSLYYADADIPDVQLDPERTALLVIDIQNTYFERPRNREDVPAADMAEWERWQSFDKRMREVAMPTVRRLQDSFREHGRDVLHARIACLTADGRDRSLSQRRPGFNNIMLPKDDYASQIAAQVAPAAGEIVVTKTTDSALTGTNLRLVLQNMGIYHVVVAGIFTDQCVASTVRSLADESFDVVLIEDGCAAISKQLHDHELTIINNIYCQVMSADDVLEILGW